MVSRPIDLTSGTVNELIEPMTKSAEGVTNTGEPTNAIHLEINVTPRPSYRYRFINVKKIKPI